MSLPSSPQGKWLRRSGLVATGAAALTALFATGCARHRAEPQPDASSNAGADDWLKTEREVPPSNDLRALINRFEDGRDGPTRQWTLAAIAKLGEPAAVVWLARLAVRDKRVDRWAEDALADIRNRHAGLELGDVATSSGPPRVRAAAIRAIAASGDLPQAAQLSALLADRNQPLLVRESSASSLGLMRRPAAIPALATALEGALADTKMTGQQFRVTIVQALGRIGTAPAHEILERHARRDLSPTERAIVEGTIADIERASH
jgi:HEAT repeat protein